VSRPALEVADIFRDHGPGWRKANAGHVSLGQLKVMSAIESCRTAALGGHVARCEDCSHTLIAYNSCRNRHCPKCQGAAAKHWLAKREAELLPVPYYHVVFTLPSAIADIAYQNKAAIYDLLFKASAETLITIAADPKHLGARVGVLSVLHTWGSALTHHPHVHMIVPGGGISLDGSRWVSCRPGFFLPVRVLSRLFRRLFLDKLNAAHADGRLSFFGDHGPLAERNAFAAYLRPLRKIEWLVYSKRPFGGPKAVLAYLSRYTHRVAISNSRLIAFDEEAVTFKWKDYRVEGRDRYKRMTPSFASGAAVGAYCGSSSRSAASTDGGNGTGLRVLEFPDGAQSRPKPRNRFARAKTSALAVSRRAAIRSASLVMMVRAAERATRSAAAKAACAAFSSSASARAAERAAAMSSSAASRAFRRASVNKRSGEKEATCLDPPGKRPIDSVKTRASGRSCYGQAADTNSSRHLRRSHVST
jgi:Putative transposase/Transposase zinc-binding domain